MINSNGQIELEMLPKMKDAKPSDVFGALRAGIVLAYDDATNGFNCSSRLRELYLIAKVAQKHFSLGGE
jgi:hypothetical protein